MRNVVITGAASGLGRITLEKFAAGGDRVYACDVSAEALGLLESSGATVLTQVADVSQYRDVRAFVAAILGDVDGIDVLINNVGIAGPRAALEQIEPDEWTHTLDANLSAVFWTTREVLPSMKRRRCGCILNVSTVSVQTMPELRAPYIVSKAGLEALTLAIARETGPFDVRCNAVRPGFMDNERLTSILVQIAQQSGKTLSEVEAEGLRFVSMRSKVAMDEVASMLHYLASEAARHITGQIIAVDGGVQWEG